MDLRLRMVMVGLVLGIVIAIAVAAEGCGHHAKENRAAAPVSAER